jgi:hypothetical protein
MATTYYFILYIDRGTLSLNVWYASCEILHRTKKYQINASMPVFNSITGLYESSDASYTSYVEARKYQWKCDKCYERFQSYKKLRNHKSQLHSY